MLKVREFLPDLILLDMSMSGIDGIETAEKLRQQGYAATLLVLSANAYPSDRMAALKAGCNDFLSKPIRAVELLYKLKLHLFLDWLYRQDDGETPQFNEPSAYQIPPLAMMQHCVDCVRIGDMLGLKKILEQLSQAQPQYAPYFHKLSNLANQFRIGEIRKLLQMTSK